jgi:hypothetical protein
LVKRALVACAVLTAAIFVTGVPAALSAPGDSRQACSNPGNGIPAFCTDLPRGLWCNARHPDVARQLHMVAPLNAVDLVVIQGKTLEGAGLVSAADWATGVGAFCPGAPQVAGKALTLVGTKVNNLGQSIVGDQGAIYNLATVG